MRVRNRKNIIILSCTIIVLIILVAVGFVMLNMENEQHKTMKVDYLEIDTPVCVLKYPLKWEEAVRYEELNLDDSYEIKFICKLEDETVDLFSIYLNSEKGQPIGTMDNGMGISIMLYKLDTIDKWNNEYKEIAYMMQEDMNVIISNLEKDYGLNDDIVIEETEYVEALEKKYGTVKESAFMSTETKYCKLYYPERWEKCLKIIDRDDCTYSLEYVAQINKKEYPLFTIHFENNIGNEIGSYETNFGKNISIYIEQYVGDKINELEGIDKTQYYMMCEDANYLIERLSSEKGFTPK